MTIIHNQNIVSLTIAELKEIMRIAIVEHEGKEDTEISIEVDEKGNGKVSGSNPFSPYKYEDEMLSGTKAEDGVNKKITFWEVMQKYDTLCVINDLIEMADCINTHGIETAKGDWDIDAEIEGAKQSLQDIEKMINWK